ncbi:MAG: hypothetical protein ACRD0K_23450 [Egibacteraceae bacterium]
MDATLGQGVGGPSTGAISRARARLGPQPPRALLARVCRPLATEATPGAHCRHWRLTAIDRHRVPTSPTRRKTTRRSPRPGSGRSEKTGAFGQVRMVGLGGCGTHAITDAVMDGAKTSEVALTHKPLDGLGPDRLGPGVPLLADRGALQLRYVAESRRDRRRPGVARQA